MVVDLEHLSGEITQIREKGISVGPKNLKLSTRATISMPWHRIQDILEEDRLARSGSSFGSTRRGIAYAYSARCQKYGTGRMLSSGTDVLPGTSALVSEAV